MNRFRPVTLAMMITLLSAVAASGDPMADVCRMRAEKGSGYSGSRPGLSKQVGQAKLRLSGSVAVGVSRSSDGQGGHRAPAFAGDASSERRQVQAQNKYTRIYENCMRAR